MHEVAHPVLVCILEGPGRSTHIGLEKALVKQNATPQGVCMSEAACLDLVSQKFPVKEAFRKGECINNPNVVELCDDEIRRLLNL